MSHSQIKKGRVESDAAYASEKQLSEWLRACDRKGALPAAEAAMDVAYAQGYKRGLEEGRAEHVDGLRTLLMRVLETKLASIDDGTLDRIEGADVASLETWLLELTRPDDEAVGA